MLLHRHLCLCASALLVTGALAAEKPTPSVTLDPWHVCGPFKDEGFGNVLRSFRTEYGPEAQAIAAGHKPLDPSTTHRSPEGNEPRPWTVQSAWTDGYRHLLPRGPAPSRNESTYLARTIHADDAITPTLRIYAEDFVAVWLNGRRLGEAIRNYSAHHYPVPLVIPLPLEQGDNQLLVKITSMFGAHGFAFGLDGITPSNSLKPLEWSPEILRKGGSNFHSFHQPLRGGHPSATSDRTADARRLVESTRFEVTMTPMFDPPASKMQQLMDQTVPSSEGGRSYLHSLQRAKTKDTPGGTIDPVTAATALVAHWERTAAAVGPIVYIECPPFAINAIAPYTSAGAAPASIRVFDPARPDQEPRTIFHEDDTAIFDFNLSFDARTIFFSAKRPGVSGGWQLYEIGVDGKGLKQITSGPGNSISPAELPDGRIVFVSDHANTWVQCQGKKAGLIYSCERDGSNVRLLSANIDSDHSPQVMNDGRVLFTRWDYGVEKNVFARHALWTMNPDGTALRLFFGNTIEDPAGFWEARPVPGRPEVACAFGPHHNFHAGMVGLVWDRLGPEAPRGEGFRFLTDEIPCYCDTKFAAGFQDIFPLHERLFLVSYGGDGGLKNRLYLLDDRGNRRCLLEAPGKQGIWNPVALQPRPTPPIIPSQSTTPQWTYRDPLDKTCPADAPDPAVLFVQDVLRGLEPGIQREEIAEIQILEQVEKSPGMAGGEAWGHTPVIGRGTVHARRLIGNVPVEKDGSAHFEVPSLRSISFNVLDHQGRTLMRMGSDMVAMPGERQGCIGCHENRDGGIAPAPDTKPPLAMTKPPVIPKRPDWGTDGLLDYQKVIQPVWDRNCLPCHDGPAPAAGIDLTGDRTRFFCMSYDNIVERDLVDWHQPFAGDHDETAPRGVGSVKSRLVDILNDEKHLEGKMPDEDKRRVLTWIDANVPYYPTYSYTEVRGIGARDSWEDKPGGWLQTGLRPVFEQRCLDCHEREAHNPGFWGFGGGSMDRTFTVSSELWTDRGLTAHMFPTRNPMGALLGPELRINLTRPAHSSMLQAPLAKNAGGWGLCREENGEPVFDSTNDPGYQRILTAIELGKAGLYQRPRVDMEPGHVASILPTTRPNDQLAAALKSWQPSASARLTKGMAIIETIPPDQANLALDAKADSPDDIPLQGNPGQVSESGANDGNPATFWDELDGRPEYRLRLKFDTSTTVSALSLTGWRHHDFAPKAFRILADGEEVGRVAKAVYLDNQFAVTFPRTTCQSFELVITQSHGGSPAIRELGLYDLAE